MAIISNHPSIAALRLKVESTFGRKPAVHSDFVTLSERIENSTRQHISESTLERVWNYSTRGYATVSLRTLDVLASFCDDEGWSVFCERLRLESSSESEFFDVEAVRVDDLMPGDRVRFGWLPDRLCIARYLGNHRFVAEECENSKIQPGDTFSCLIFQLGEPLKTEDFRNGDGTGNGQRYTVGIHNGLTALSVI